MTEATPPRATGPVSLNPHRRGSAATLPVPPTPTKPETSDAADQAARDAAAHDRFERLAGRERIAGIGAPRGGGDADDMDMTPMVDVTFLLLIFFMITAAFALQKAIEIPPSSQEQSAAAPTLDELEEDSIVVRIDGDNVYWIGCPAWPDEKRTPSQQEMRARVREARREGEGGRGFTKLLVRASGDATHEFVVAALDAGSAAGVEQIRLMSYEDDNSL